MKRHPKAPRVYMHRKFLNGRSFHSTACLYTKIDKYGVTFKLSDCDRMVTLDFDSGTGSKSSTRKVSQKNALRKVDVLVSELKEFQKALAAHFEYEDRVKEFER